MGANTTNMLVMGRPGCENLLGCFFGLYLLIGLAELTYPTYKLLISFVSMLTKHHKSDNLRKHA